MGMTNSLMDVMNEVSSALDNGSFAPSLSKASSTPVGEMEAFRQLDPLLASLYKEFQNAKQIRIQAAQEYGANDAMTDMAQLAEDSAWCAMQTRYMEVRADRAMMREAQAIMEQSLRECEREEKEKAEQEALVLLAKMQMVQAMQSRETSGHGNVELWMALLILFTRNFPVLGFPYYATHQFNKLAA